VREELSRNGADHRSEPLRARRCRGDQEDTAYSRHSRQKADLSVCGVFAAALEFPAFLCNFLCMLMVRCRSVAGLGHSERCEQGTVQGGRALLDSRRAGVASVGKGNGNPVNAPAKAAKQSVTPNGVIARGEPEYGTHLCEWEKELKLFHRQYQVLLGKHCNRRLC
jgi:hypothetical protein